MSVGKAFPTPNSIKTRKYESADRNTRFGRLKPDKIQNSKLIHLVSFFRMGFLDKLAKTLDLWLADEEAEDVNYQKGTDFEKYVAGLFTRRSDYFAISDWTRDNHDKSKGIYVESNTNPDLVIRYKPTNEKFAVECKYRSGFYRSQKINGPVVKWAAPDQIKRYNAYSRSNHIPVFVVVGVGGSPNNPATMFCIPLNDAKYPEIFPSVFEKYERDPGKTFFWRDGMLK